MLGSLVQYKLVTSSIRVSGTGALLRVLRNSYEQLFYNDLGTTASEEQDLLLELLFAMLQVFTINRNCFTMRVLHY